MLAEGRGGGRMNPDHVVLVKSVNYPGIVGSFSGQNPYQSNCGAEPTLLSFPLAILDVSY